MEGMMEHRGQLVGGGIALLQSALKVREIKLWYKISKKNCLWQAIEIDNKYYCFLEIYLNAFLFFVYRIPKISIIGIQRGISFFLCSIYYLSPKEAGLHIVEKHFPQLS